MNETRRLKPPAPTVTKTLLQSKISIANDDRFDAWKIPAEMKGRVAQALEQDRFRLLA